MAYLKKEEDHYYTTARPWDLSLADCSEAQGLLLGYGAPKGRWQTEASCDVHHFTNPTCRFEGNVNF